MLNFQSDRAILLQCPAFAGGDLIDKCLSLSRYACSNDVRLVKHLLKNPTDYQIKFDSALKTLPPSHDMHNWWFYDFNIVHLFGPMADEWRSNGTSASDWQSYDIAGNRTTETVIELSNSNIHFFLSSHSNTCSENMLKVWPQAKIITLINHQKFCKISSRIRSKVEDAHDWREERYNLIKGNNWPTWYDFEQSGYNINNFIQLDSEYIIAEMFKYYLKHNTDKLFTFDIDNCIFDQNKFLLSIEELYQKLNFDDFNPNLVGNFWKAYIDLYIDIT